MSKEVMTEYRELLVQMSYKLRDTITDIKSYHSPDAFNGRSRTLLLDVYHLLNTMYYEFDRSLLPDEHYDMLCKYLDKTAEADDPLKDAFQAGTGLAVKPPTYIRNIIGLWHKE